MLDYVPKWYIIKIKLTNWVHKMDINSLLLKSKQLTSQMTGVYELSMSGFSHADLTEMVGVALNLCSSLHNDIQNNIDELKNTGKPTTKSKLQIEHESTVESSGLPNTYSLPNTFAERLRLALAYSGMTQDDLAWKIGLSQGAINSYVTGKVKEAGIARAGEIAEAIGINAGWLRYGEGEMTDFCTSKTREL